MKKNHILATLAVMTLAAPLASCSSDDAQPSAEQGREIRFQSNLTAHQTTRATGSYEKFAQGQIFYVWADQNIEDESRSEEFITAWQLTVKSNIDEFQYGGNKMFPAYNSLNFYAIHGNFVETPVVVNETPWPEAFLTHTVKSSQLTEDDMMTSDLVFARTLDQTPSPNKVQLHFWHLLSKVEVALLHGNGITDDQLTDGAGKVTVTLLGVNTQVKLKTPTGKLSTLDLTAQSGRESLIEVIDETGSDIDVETITTADIESDNCAAAIVAPQEVDGRFIKLEYLGHVTYYSVDHLTLKSGYRYRFNITLDRIGDTYTITPTIDPWANESQNVWVE